MSTATAVVTEEVVRELLDAHEDVRPDGQLEWHCTCGEPVPVRNGSIAPYRWHRQHVAAALAAGLNRQESSSPTIETRASAEKLAELRKDATDEGGVFLVPVKNTTLIAVLDDLQDASDTIGRVEELADTIERDSPKPGPGGFIAQTIRETLHGLRTKV